MQEILYNGVSYIDQMHLHFQTVRTFIRIELGFILRTCVIKLCYCSLCISPIQIRNIASIQRSGIFSAQGHFTSPSLNLVENDKEIGRHLLGNNWIYGWRSEKRLSAVTWGRETSILNNIYFIFLHRIRGTHIRIAQIIETVRLRHYILPMKINDDS